MLTENDAEQIKKAIESAKRQRNQIVEQINELEKLRERLHQLEVFISHGNALLGKAESQIFKENTEGIRKVRIRRPLVEKLIWKGIVEILKEFKRPMHLKEMAEEFHKRRWKLSRANGPEVIRYAIKRKPDLFIRIEDGAYDLAN
jgi:dsDNA-specific endonuclease/ATPase MutS2